MAESINCKGVQISGLSVRLWRCHSITLRKQADALIRGNRYPIVGRVTMDQTLVDLTDAPDNLEVGETVTLIGNQGSGNFAHKTHEDAGNSMGTTLLYNQASAPECTQPIENEAGLLEIKIGLNPRDQGFQFFNRRFRSS